MIDKNKIVSHLEERAKITSRLAQAVVTDTDAAKCEAAMKVYQSIIEDIRSGKYDVGNERDAE